MPDDPLDELQRYVLRRPAGNDVLARARAAWDQPVEKPLAFPIVSWLAIAALVTMAVDIGVVESLIPPPAPTVASDEPIPADRAYINPGLVTPAMRARPADPSVTVAALNRHLESLP